MDPITSMESIKELIRENIYYLGNYYVFHIHYFMYLHTLHQQLNIHRAVRSKNSPEIQMIKSKTILHF